MARTRLAFSKNAIDFTIEINIATGIEGRYDASLLSASSVGASRHKALEILDVYSLCLCKYICFQSDKCSQQL